MYAVAALVTVEMADSKLSKQSNKKKIENNITHHCT